MHPIWHNFCSFSLNYIQTYVLKYFVVDQNLSGHVSVSWEDSVSVEEWLNRQPHQMWKQTFEEKGVLVSSILL